MILKSYVLSFVRISYIKSQHFHIERTQYQSRGPIPYSAQEAKWISSDKYDELSTVSYSFRINRKEALPTWSRTCGTFLKS